MFTGLPRDGLEDEGSSLAVVDISEIRCELLAAQMQQPGEQRNKNITILAIVHVPLHPSNDFGRLGSLTTFLLLYLDYFTC